MDGKELIKSLEEFVEKLESGVPIEVTRVRRIETPDGAMHIQEKKVLGEGDG